ncbi:hypothetical protein [Thalassolituus sp.]|jgi:hypothetical protein|uniref:hypothetical protein n=1 Tax=Thalassolituus sp. TaxID=2030822 RepID=UPI002A83E9F0|nr:hypothetical protein [Thalassolituus sp.]|tara:strand:- start:918 stop:1262 length:345 start_codon:yes stop_codon:yes gene_type:complete
MNIWSLQKEPKLKSLLIILQEYLGREAFVIDMDTPVSWEAIYIRDPHDEDLCAYLYTYGEGIERYGLHLEYPKNSENYSYDVFESLTAKRVAEMLAVHFDVYRIGYFPQSSGFR